MGRYLRHAGLLDWDQDKLAEACVLVAGVGGLGSASSLYLAAAGVGRLRLCDPDRVELPDLNRQVLYSMSSLGKPKVEEAARRLSALNPETAVEIFEERLTAENIDRLAAECDVIVDGLDNMEGRFVLNSYSVRRAVPYVFGAVHGWEGMAALIQSPQTGCLSCLLPRVPPPPEETIPVAGFLPGTIGVLQAAQALKRLMGVEGTPPGRLLIYDGRTMTFDLVAWEKNPDCSVCGSFSERTGRHRLMK
ncbi:MAG: HesA/MoeB/ThiF family protein [Candidatus Aminicenantes bacterium]|nr:HesA/MoeB/ThiF family protein [Candidatus Aminicenantes bacterium]